MPQQYQRVTDMGMTTSIASSRRTCTHILGNTSLTQPQHEGGSCGHAAAVRGKQNFKYPRLQLSLRACRGPVYPTLMASPESEQVGFPAARQLLPEIPKFASNHVVLRCATSK